MREENYTNFLKNDFVTEISKALRPEDEIWMSEIFYAGGTAVKNISSNDLIKEIMSGKIKNTNEYKNLSFTDAVEKYEIKKFFKKSAEAEEDLANSSIMQGDKYILRTGGTDYSSLVLNKM